MSQPHDQHFTNENEALRLVTSRLDRHDPLRAFFYIEPSCGQGAIVEALRKSGVPAEHIRTVDIDPKMPADVHCDFLTATRSTLRIEDWPSYLTVAIGNPPFGNNAKLARQFLNHAATFATWTCFVMPRSLHSAHGCGNLNPRLELLYEQELSDSFETTKAKCNWQEWYLLPEGCQGRRPTEATADPDGLYSIVSLGEAHDIVIQRCGGSAGRVTTCNGTGQGKYYIRSPYHEVVAAFQALGKHEEAGLTTHQPSLSARLLHELVLRRLLSNHIASIKGENENSY